MNMKNRPRGRNGGGKPRPHQPHQGRSQNFDNNNMRMRGNAQQLMEKYLQLARDASSQGDRVMAENYFQHADHYYRVINARFEQNGQRRPDQQGRNDRPFDGNDQFSDYNQPNYGNSNAPPQMPQHDDPPQQSSPSYQNQPQYEPQQHQPQHQQPQQPHQPRHQQPQQPRHQQPQAQQPQQQPEGDIGLPPQILGEPLPALSEPAGQAAEGDDQASRPRQPSRRRGPGRAEGAEPTAEPTAETAD